MKTIKTSSFEKLTEKDLIPGGLADNKPSSRFNKKELGKGVGVEKEHTGREDVAKEIAKDHLTEDPEYYTKLDKAGL
jgi:hypothetical protein